MAVDSCVFNYIEIIPFDNDEELKPFQVKVCIVTNLAAWDSKIKKW